METLWVANADEVLPLLQKYGIAKKLAKEALARARQHGQFTVLFGRDALTPFSSQ